MNELRERVRTNKLTKLKQIKERGLVKIGSKNQIVLDGWYEISESIDTPAKLGNWLLHLREKNWFTLQMLDDFLYLLQDRIER